MDRHELRDGTVLELEDLTEAQRRHLAAAWAAYERGQPFNDFMNEWMHNGGPPFFEGGDVRGGRRLLGAEVVAAPLWKVLQDLSLRLGVAQGQLRDEPGAAAALPHGRHGGLPS